MNRLLKEMMAHADPSQVAGLSRFFKTGPGQYGEGDKFLGIKVPVTREVVRGCWKEMLEGDAAVGLAGAGCPKRYAFSGAGGMHSFGVP